METPTLDWIRWQLRVAQGDIAVVTLWQSMWDIAKRVVAQELGPPEKRTPERWIYPHVEVRFYAEDDPRRLVDFRAPHPICGYSGPIVRFGFAACDEFYGIEK